MNMIRLFVTADTDFNLEKFLGFPEGILEKMKKFNKDTDPAFRNFVEASDNPDEDYLVFQWLGSLCYEAYTYSIYGFGKVSNDAAEYIAAQGWDLYVGMTTDPVHIKNILVYQNILKDEDELPGYITSVSWS
jgi:uncharacterized protein (DUF849 family)